MSVHRIPFSIPLGSVLLVALIAQHGCTDEAARRNASQESTPSRTLALDDASPEKQSFLQDFELVDTVALQQDGRTLLVQNTGIDIAPDGRMAVADGTEGNVKIYLASGHLDTILGRPGEGPGEFRAPRAPSFDALGRLFIPDGVLRKIVLFDRSGALVRTIQLDSALQITSVARLPNSDFLFTTRIGPNVLHRFDSAGKAVGSYFAIPPVMTQDPNSGFWKMFRFYLADATTDTAFVVSSLSDTLWAVDLRDGNRTSQRLRFPGYLEPRLPGRSLGRTELNSWRSQYHMAGSILVGQDLVLVAFARGILGWGDAFTLVYRLPNGQWRYADDAPVPLRLIGNDLLAIYRRDDSNNDYILGTYRLRR